MSWKLTPEERRIIERTKREGERLYASEDPGRNRKRTWTAVVVWAAVILMFVVGAALIYYIGTLV